MQTTLEDIKKTAKLAKFDITEQEALLYTKQMADVLEWVAQLQSVDTSSPKAQNSYTNSAPLREDKPSVCAYAAEISAAFNDKQGNNLKVKKVL